MKIPSRFDRSGRSGFALVASLLLLLLLGVICLGMLSLSTISLRTTERGNAASTARSNARLALMLAIGELQKSAGPDQRVTAPASIRKTAAKDKQYYTGVWNSGEWNPAQSEKKPFVSWLVSDPALLASTGNGIEYGDSSNPPGGVTLVGAGTMDGRTAGSVTVPSLSLNDGSRASRLAYWVADEGIKARYNLTATKPTGPFADSTSWSTTPRWGIQKMPGLDGYATVTDADRFKALSLKSISLAQPPVSGGKFHDLTTDSEGLAVDVRQGGAKKDLSLAFELPLDEFNAVTEFHGAKEINGGNGYDSLNPAVYHQPEFYPSTHKLGYVYEIPAESGLNNPARVRGPTWDLLRNHYRLYKRDWEKVAWPRKVPASADALEARGSLPLSYSTGFSSAISGRWFISGDEGCMYHKDIKSNTYAARSVLRQQTHSEQFRYGADLIRRTSEGITPIITRVTLVAGLMKYTSGTDEVVGVSLSPYFTVLNPYSQPLEFHSIGLYATRFSPLQFEVSYVDSSGAAQKSTFDPSNDTYAGGSLALRLDPATNGGKTRMAPGEMRVICPAEIPGGKQGNSSKNNPVPGTIAYNEAPSLVYGAFKTAPNSTVKLVVRGRPGGTHGDAFVFSLFHPVLHQGEARNLVTDMPPVGGAGGTDHWDRNAMDDPFILRLIYTMFPGPDGVMTTERSVNASQIPRVGDGAQFVAALDMWVRDFKTDGVPVLAQYNPRAYTTGPQDHDGTHRISPNWDISLGAITDISTLNLVTADGKGRWGGGASQPADNPSHLVLYEIPRAPLVSLASLQHADIGSLPSDAGYAIGNSFAPPALPMNTIFGKMGWGSFRYCSAVWGPQPQIDNSWAANEALWDRYFFSGFNWGTEGNRYPTLDEAATAARSPAEDSPFLNPRVHLADAPADVQRLRQYDKIADHLAVRGAFNVNSTSVAAWKAVLAGLDQTELAYRDDATRHAGKFDSPLTRFTDPQGGKSDPYRGFRSLNDSQLDALATAIVDQVKERGPFMGLSDFVNRRLTTTEHGRNGALQAAIDKAGLNADLGNKPNTTVIPNAADSTQAGLPGYLTQADVLTTIGGAITARSDTFKVRAYGEAVDPSGRVIARAWCEAIVQRTPEWCQPTDLSPTIADSSYPMNLNAGDSIFRPFKANPEFPEINRAFGRRFEITGFRWLSASEV